MPWGDPLKKLLEYHLAAMDPIRGVHHNFAPGRFTYAPVFSDDTMVHTTIINTEELVQNVFYKEELVRAGIYFLRWYFLIFAPGQISPQTSCGVNPCPLVVTPCRNL